MSKLLWIALMLLLPSSFVAAEETPEEIAKSLKLGFTAEPEKVFTSSEVIQMTISCSNNVAAGASPVMVEIREGGCLGKLKARLVVEAGDILSTYQTKGDFVRMTCTDTTLPNKYQYGVVFNVTTTVDAKERTFTATGKNRINSYIYNNAGGKTNVLIKATEGEIVQTDSIVPPKFHSNYYDTADKVTIKASDAVNTRYYGNFNFSQPQ